MLTNEFIVDANAPISQYHTTESLIYVDDFDVERVAYSGALYETKDRIDMEVAEYIKFKKGHEPNKTLKVIDKAEYEKRINTYKAERLKEEEAIEKSDWWWFFECLPPCRWSNRSGVELFHMSERLSFDLVHWVGRIGDKHYKLVDKDTADLSVVANRFIELDKRLSN